MKIIVATLLLCLSTGLQAAETTSVKVKGNATKGDIDTEITDAKMRADSGSKSKFSGSLSLNYTGGSFDDPFSNARPNVDGGEEEPVSLDGSVGIRYRINKNDSLYLSTGISKVRPFDNRKEDNWEAKNPTLMWGSWFRYKDTQLRTSLMTYVYTEDFYRDTHHVATLAGTIGTMNQIGNSRFNFGLTNYLSYTFFDGKTKYIPQFDSFLDIRPTLQYKFNDRFNVYTSIGLLSFYHTRDRSSFNYKKADITQTLGAGIAITRDFYLAPNIDFLPEDIRADNTTVNLSAIVNIL